MHVLHASSIDQVLVLLHADMCMCTCICTCTHAYIYAHMSMYRHVYACMCACVWQMHVDPEKFRALARRGDANELIAVYQMLQEQVLLCLLAYACISCICVLMVSFSLAHFLPRACSLLCLSVSNSLALYLCTSLSLPLVSLSLSLSLSTLII